MRIALSDIDGTLIIKIEVDDKKFYAINTDVIAEWRKNNIENVYLFSNMALTDMDNIPEPAGSINHISRNHLVDYLEAEGFKVIEVITQADPYYKNKPGAAYRHFYLPAYEACMRNPTQYHLDKTAENSFNKNYMQYVELLQYNPEYDANNKPASQKRLMLKYFNAAIPAEIDEIFYYEDDQSCIDAIEPLKNELGLSITSILINSKKMPDIHNLSLVIPGSDNYEKVINELGDEVSKFKLHLAKMTVATLENITHQELQQIEFLYQHHKNFSTSFADNLKSSHYGSKNEWDLSIKQDINNEDYQSARRKIITAMASLLFQNKEIYKKMTNKPTEANIVGFSSSATDKTIFQYFPNLLQMFLPSTSLELNKIACSMGHALEEISNKKIDLKALRETVNNNRPNHTLLIWKNAKEHDMVTALTKAITEMILLVGNQMSRQDSDNSSTPSFNR